jgi:hypothetical protein
MKLLIRILGVLLAIYMLVTSAMDILGVIHRGGFGDPAVRFRSNFVAIVAAVLLFVNWKKVKRGAPLFVYLTALFAVTLWYSWSWMFALARIFATRAHFVIMPIYLLILAVLWGTFWMAMNYHFAGSRR